MIRPKKSKISKSDQELLDELVKTDMIQIVEPKILPNGVRMAHYDD